MTGTGAEGNIHCVKDNLIYLAPFLGMGAAGGVIRELNTKTFSWKELFIRAITGAFGASLAGLYLKNTAYPIEMQFAIAGAIGTTACELIQAVQKWLMRKLGGEAYDIENQDILHGMDTASTLSDTDNSSNNNSYKDIHTGEEYQCKDCWTDECHRTGDERCKKE